jgi:molecular chaperone DnaK
MTITGGTKLADDEIQRMMREAEQHADEDRQRREEAEVRNQADNVIYQTEKTLKEHGEKLDESDRKGIEDALNDAKEALKGSDVDRIRQTSDALMSSSQKFAEVLYQRAQTEQQEAGGASGASTSAGDEEVVDAEVVDDGNEEQSA